MAGKPQTMVRPMPSAADLAELGFAAIDAAAPEASACRLCPACGGYELERQGRRTEQATIEWWIACSRCGWEGVVLPTARTLARALAPPPFWSADDGVTPEAGRDRSPTPVPEEGRHPAA